MSAATGATPDLSVLASKRVVYVSGLAEQATISLVRAAMIPFGNIKSVDMPMDYTEGKHRGFAFVEYDEADDATEAIFNMDGAELMGRTLKVSLAQANQVSKLSRASASSEAIWKSDEWFQQQVAGVDGQALADRQTKEADSQTLRDF